MDLLVLWKTIGKSKRKNRILLTKCSLKSCIALLSLDQESSLYRDHKDKNELSQHGNRNSQTFIMSCFYLLSTYNYHSVGETVISLSRKSMFVSSNYYDCFMCFFIRKRDLG